MLYFNYSFIINFLKFNINITFINLLNFIIFSMFTNINNI